MTDAITPSIDEITRGTDLPAQDTQQAETTTEAQELHALRMQPGWRIIEERLERFYERYRNPQFPPDMPYEEIGKEYMLSQQMAVMIKEVLDDVRGD